jgi:hypothetical protein
MRTPIDGPAARGPRPAARGGEVLGVCDVFGRQELNVDHSGEGSRELFVANLDRFGVDPARVRIFAKRSDALTPDDTTTGCRFFHIDGGHRAEDVVADLKSAAAALSDEGIVAVDDAFNPSWPGVDRFPQRIPGSSPRSSRREQGHARAPRGGRASRASGRRASSPASSFDPPPSTSG